MRGSTIRQSWLFNVPRIHRSEVRSGLNMNYEELEAWRKNKRCAICKEEPPRIAWLDGEWHLRCGCHPKEPKLERVKSYTERFKENEVLPIYISNRLDDKLRGE